MTTDASPFDALVESYQWHGLSLAAARLAAAGRDGAGVGSTPAAPFDRLVESYRRNGMTAEGARQAAIGRDHRTEAEARTAGDHVGVLRAAEQAAERVTSLTESYTSRGLRAPVRPIRIREVATTDQAAMLVAEVASARLGMPPAEARQYAVRLAEREISRGGYEHTLTWLRRLADALGGQVAA